MSRIENPTKEDYKRIEKYRRAADRILYALEDDEDNKYNDIREIEINGILVEL